MSFTTQTNPVRGLLDRRPSSTLDRRRLIDHIEDFRASGGRLMTVWAPAGAGKTALLTQWESILAARDVPHHVVEPCRDELETLIDELTVRHRSAAAGERRTLPAERWVLVDDLQQSDPTGTAFVRLLGVVPDGTRVLIVGRYEPSEFGAVVEAAGGRTTLRTAELRFTAGETHELAAAFGIPLTVADAERLTERTAGWAAGIALAMPYLSSEPDPAAAIVQFDGDQHSVADYLVVRVLDELDDHDRSVLMRAAVTEHVPLDLAVTLTRQRDAGAVLERLSIRNTLVDRDRAFDGFRFHPLLVSYMCAESRRRDEIGAIEAHATAAAWYEAAGDHESAMAQALRSRDRGVVRTQLEHSGLVLLMQGRSASVAVALRFVAPVTSSLPIAVVRLAMDLPDFRDRIGAAERLAEVHRLMAVSSEADIALWTPYVHAISGFMVLEKAEAERTLATLSAYLRVSSLGSLDIALGIRSAIAWCLVVAGRYGEAEPLLRSVQAAALRAGYAWVYLMATDGIATLAARRGDWRAATVQEGRMAALPFDATPPYNRATARAVLVNAAYAYERCEPVSFTPARLVEAADPTGDELGQLFQAKTLLLIAALDNEHAPRESLSRLLQLARTEGDDHPRAVAAAAPRIHFWSNLLNGASAAAEARRVIVSILGVQSLEAQTLRVLATNRADYGAVRALADAVDGDHLAWTGSSLVAAHLALAAHAHDGGSAAEAADRVRRALDLSEEFGYAREFLACRGLGARLVLATRGSFGALEPYAAHVLDRCAAERVDLGADSDEPAAPLTPKERALLEELPAHQTLGEIAAKHHLSVNTVKTHLRSIYAKLGVTGRTEAVHAGRKHGLL
ncbi:LuxR C-terminal-related transcriptional regulator [Curtobacterium sp. L3-7]|uniref:helix-turn-helix transcriptional regulator n=1 Tax=Curtobacterium sp. L3-7 TaxID=3138787 RepID=UPI003B5198BA